MPRSPNDSNMAKHYVYRLDHDLGFAPNVAIGICTLCGCKMTSIERRAREGSWVVGIGGNRTGKANKLIYAMKVMEVVLYAQFRLRYRRKSKYLEDLANELKLKHDTPVLVSREFFYFGDNAIDLPAHLQGIVFQGRGCMCLLNRDVARLQKYLTRNYENGVLGRPSNAPQGALPDAVRSELAKHSRRGHRKSTNVGLRSACAISGYNGTESDQSAVALKSTAARRTTTRGCLFMTARQ